MAEHRPPLHAYVSEAAHEGWMAVSSEYGISYAALLEVFGREFKRYVDKKVDLETADRPVWLRRIKEARRIDASRRRRKRER